MGIFLCLTTTYGQAQGGGGGFDPKSIDPAAVNPQMAEDYGIKIKKTVSFILQDVNTTQKGTTFNNEFNVRADKDMTAYGVRGDFQIKLSESARQAWFGGVDIALLKGKFKQKTSISKPGSTIDIRPSAEPANNPPKSQINGKGDLDTGFQIEIFAEWDYLLSRRWAFIARSGLANSVFKAKEDKKTKAELASTIVDAVQRDFSTLANAADDTSLEIFTGLGVAYAVSESASVSAMLRISLLNLASSPGNNEYDTMDRINITVLHFDYSM